MSEPISKGGTAHPRLTRQQKAAAVIVSLGTDKASQLYQYMDPEDVEQITLEVAKLGYLDSSATEDVLTEYYQMCMTNKAVTEGGLEYARAVLEKAFGQQTATSLLEKVTKSLKNREFAFLNKADEKSLYAALQHERPQTIALVLSYVDAEKSAAVIEELDDERQVRVEGAAQIEEHRKQEAERIRSFLEQAAAARDSLLEQAQNELCELSLAVAEKVIHISLRTSRDVIARMIQVATEKLKRREWVHIYVGGYEARDLAQITPELTTALAGLSEHIKIIPMSDDELGACIIEMPDEIIDASASTQLNNIRDVLSGG